MQAPSIPSACVFRPATSGMSSIPSHPDATCIPSHRGVPPHRDVFHHQNSSGCVLHHQIGMCHPNTWLEVSTHASSNPYKFSVMQVSIPRDGVRNGWVVAVWGAVDTSRCVWIEAPPAALFPSHAARADSEFPYIIIALVSFLEYI